MIFDLEISVGHSSNVAGYRYIAYLYCLAVRAGFYSDTVECWIFVRKVAGSLLRRVDPPPGQV